MQYSGEQEKQAPSQTKDVKNRPKPSSALQNSKSKIKSLPMDKLFVLSAFVFFTMHIHTTTHTFSEHIS